MDYPKCTPNRKIYGNVTNTEQKTNETVLNIWENKIEKNRDLEKFLEQL